MKERDMEFGIAHLLKAALQMGRDLGKTGVIAPRNEKVMSDAEWADKTAKQFVDSLE